MKNRAKDTGKPAGDKIFYGWRIVAACFILLFCYGGAGFYSFSIFIKPLEKYFGWSRSEISFTMSIFFFVNAAVQPVLGRLCQTFGPRKVMLVGSLLGGVSFILLSLTESLLYFYIIYGSLSITLGAIAFVSVSSLLAVWFRRRRGTAIGLSFMGVSAGGLILSPIMGLIIARVGWQYTFVTLGILVWALALPMILLVIRNNPSDMGFYADGDEPLIESNPESLTEMTDGWPMGDAIRTGQFWWIVLSFSLASIGMMGVLQHLIPLVTEKGIAYTYATIALGMTSAMGGLGKFGLGRLSETLSFKRVMVICFGMQMIGVMLLSIPGNIVVLWLYTLIFGFGMGGLIVLQPLAISQYFGLKSFGVLFGICQFFHSIGNSLGAIISGLLHDHFNNYGPALALYIAVYLIAISAIFLCGRPRRYGRKTI